MAQMGFRRSLPEVHSPAPMPNVCLHIQTQVVLFFFSCFLGLHLRHMEVPRLGVQMELQRLSYTKATATAMQEPSHICNLHHSSWQRWILNPLSEGRDQILIPMDLSWVHYRWATTGTPICAFFPCHPHVILWPFWATFQVSLYQREAGFSLWGRLGHAPLNQPLKGTKEGSLLFYSRQPGLGWGGRRSLAWSYLSTHALLFFHSQVVQCLSSEAEGSAPFSLASFPYKQEECVWSPLKCAGVDRGCESVEASDWASQWRVPARHPAGCLSPTVQQGLPEGWRQQPEPCSRDHLTQTRQVWSWWPREELSVALLL